MRKLLVSLILLVALPLGAARDFTAGTTSLDYGARALLDSLSAWTVVAVVNNATLSGNDSIFSNFSVSSPDTADLLFRCSGTTLQAFVGNATDGQVGGTLALTLSTNTTHRVVLTYGSKTLTGYLDGVAGGTTYTTTVDFGVETRPWFIGNSPHDSSTLNWDGWIAELAFYAGYTFTQADVDSFEKRASPQLIRPDNLTFYAPLLQRNHDLISGTDPSATGSIVEAVHPPILYPTMPISGFAAAAVPPAGRRRIIIISEIMKYAPAPILAGGLGLAWVINRRNKLMRGGQ